MDKQTVPSSALYKSFTQKGGLRTVSSSEANVAAVLYLPNEKSEFSGKVFTNFLLQKRKIGIMNNYQSLNSCKS